MTEVFPLEGPERTSWPEHEKPQWTAGTPVLVDFGSRSIKTGIAGTDSAAAQFTSLAAKYRDRKTGELITLTGEKIWRDSTAVCAAKPAHDAGVVVNWDCVEMLLNEAFEKAGVNSKGCVNAPVVVSEAFACPQATRRTFAEFLFEGYGIPSVAFGVDAAFAYRHVAGKAASGIVIHTGHEATDIIPFVNGKADFPNARRISWGGRQAANYLQQLLALKYPFFPVRVSVDNAERLLQRHAYVAQDYTAELNSFLDLPGLEQRERVIQVPITGGHAVKTEEELKAIEERHRASGGRLREMAERAKAERLAQNEQQLAQLEELDEEDQNALQQAGFSSLSQLEKARKNLRANIRKALGTATPPEELEPEEAPPAPLIDIPDDQLTAEQIKEKRRQRLLRGSWEARQRAKQEKAAERERLLQAEQADLEWRKRDLEGWIKAKRDELKQLQDRAQKRRKLRAALTDRKSTAFKMRMKNIAALAATNNATGGGELPGGGEHLRKRKTKDDDDGFGADDDDWQAYRLGDSDEDEQEEMEATRVAELQQELLEFDPGFTVDDLDGMHRDWRNNVVHKFLYGAHPFSAESLEQGHQLNLNIERIRVPEVLFQPTLAGIDQAGIIEVLSNMLLRVYPSQLQDMCKSVIVTGGFNQLPGLCERIKSDLVCEMPIGTEVKVRRSSNPELDAWKGMAEWAVSPEAQDAFVSRSEYDANGPLFRKPHAYGNVQAQL